MSFESNNFFRWARSWYIQTHATHRFFCLGDIRVDFLAQNSREKTSSTADELGAFSSMKYFLEVQLSPRGHTSHFVNSLYPAVAPVALGAFILSLETCPLASNCTLSVVTIGASNLQASRRRDPLRQKKKNMKRLLRWCRRVHYGQCVRLCAVGCVVMLCGTLLASSSSEQRSEQSPPQKRTSRTKKSVVYL